MTDDDDDAKIVLQLCDHWKSCRVTTAMVLALSLRCGSRYIRTLAQRRSLNKAWSSSRMSFHFASQEYANCFVGLPQPDTKRLRASTLDYLDKFDSKLWYDEPVSESNRELSIVRIVSVPLMSHRSPKRLPRLLFALTDRIASKG